MTLKRADLGKGVELRLQPVQGLIREDAVEGFGVRDSVAVGAADLSVSLRASVVGITQPKRRATVDSVSLENSPSLFISDPTFFRSRSTPVESSTGPVSSSVLARARPTASSAQRRTLPPEA